jgi:hypothetical protein
MHPRVQLPRRVPDFATVCVGCGGFSLPGSEIPHTPLAAYVRANRTGPL